MVHEGRRVNFLTMVGKLEASTAVEDLVLSQEDKSKRLRSAREISYETAILRSSVYKIIHRDL